MTAPVPSAPVSPAPVSPPPRSVRAPAEALARHRSRGPGGGRLAIVWSGLWFYAAGRAEREIDAWIGREAKLGRIWTCTDRHLAGFPFRFELRCLMPKLETVGGDAMRFTAASVEAVAQVWAPNHLVADFVGPARVDDLTTGQSYVAAWSLLQMSGVGDLSGRPERFSLQAHDLKLEQPAATGAQPVSILSAHLFEFHARRSPGQDGKPDGVDYASGFTGGQSALLNTLGAEGAGGDGASGHGDGFGGPAAHVRWRSACAPGPMRAASPSSTASTSPRPRSPRRRPRGGGARQPGAPQRQAGPRLRRHQRSGAGPRQGPAPSRGRSRPSSAPSPWWGKPGQVEGRKGAIFALSFDAGTLKLAGFPVGIVPPLF